jgi:hypothetical protein
MYPSGEAAVDGMRRGPAQNTEQMLQATILVVQATDNLLRVNQANSHRKLVPHLHAVERRLKKRGIPARYL